MFENKHRQSVKPKSGSIKSKDNFKQLTVPFKNYIDFESVLKGVKNNHRNNNTLYTEKYQDHIFWNYA